MTGTMLTVGVDLGATVRIVHAALGSEAGAIGAAVWVRREIA